MRFSPPRRWPPWTAVVAVLIVIAAVLGWRWTKSNPSADAQWRAIRIAIEEHRAHDVEAGLVRWLDAHPDDGTARFLLGELFVGQGRTNEARRALEGLRESDRAWVSAQSLLGELAIKERDAAAAEQTFRRAAERDPTAVPPRQRLIYLFSLEHRAEEARAVLWELYRITGSPTLLADIVFQLGNSEDDVRENAPELKEFLAHSPGDPWVRRASGLTLLYQERPADAFPHLEAAAQAIENDLHGRFGLAECRILLGQPFDAHDALGPMPEHPGDTSQWWLFRGRLEESQGRIADAAASLQKAVSANAKNREAHARLGQVLARIGDRAGARAHLDRAETLRRSEATLKLEARKVRSQPANPERFEHLGELCADAGLPAEARAWFEQTIRRDPTRQSAQAALARLSASTDPVPQSLFCPRLVSTPQAIAGDDRAPVGSTVAPPRFEDVASQSGLRFSYDCGERGDLFLADTMGGGVGLLDHDGDGWLDIYFVNGCTLPCDPRHERGPNRLFRNRRDGTFEDVTDRAGVAGRGYGMGCVAGDFDNDGRDDLFVTGFGQTILYRNMGDGRFVDVTEHARVGSTRWTTAAGFGDLDGDGDLDLVVACYVEADPQNSPPCRDSTGKPIHCAPGRFPAEPNYLFRNNGDGTFTDVSRDSGVGAHSGRSLGMAIADWDDDGRLDIFFANDASPNFLFRNLGGLKFEEVGLASGVGLAGSGRATASMGVVAEDLDSDGRLDLLHTNFVNESCTLRRGLGSGLFADVTLEAGLDGPTRAKTGFGAVALDANNDGVPDLFLANGHVDDRPWINSPMAQTAQLFMGRGVGRFGFDSVGPEASSYFGRAVVGRGAAAGDFDNDGRVDLVVVHRDAPVSLLRNRTPGGHWLGLRLRGAKSSRSPIGARVTCRAGQRIITRWLTSGTSYLSANDPRLWFGLGDAHTVDFLEVRWPSGAVQRSEQLPVDRILDLDEGSLIDPSRARAATR